MSDWIWWHRIRGHRVRRGGSFINPTAVSWHCEKCDITWRGSLI